MKNFLSARENPADRTSPLSLSAAASSLRIFLLLSSGNSRDTQPFLYNVINDDRASGKSNVRGA